MADLSRFQRSQPGEASRRAREVDFPIVLRGYDRQLVDQYVEEMAQLLDSLEATQTRETVVQRALDEVGEQTSSILQRAHETAEEITARSRAKAEGRLQRAEREADLLRRDADEYAERLVADTRILWDERQRLIEEMRQLADEVLGNADDAAERLPEPELLRRRPSEPDPEDGELADATTVMPALNGAVDDGPFDLAEVDPEAAEAEDGDPVFEDAPTDEPAPEGEQPTQEVDAPWLAGGDPEQVGPDATLPLPPDAEPAPVEDAEPPPGDRP
jgi:cell division septum initiation protein DivIVA